MAYPQARSLTSLTRRYTNADETWECRWDRHPNPHNTRLHFHEPLTGADIADLDLSLVHSLEVYTTVVMAIEQHIEATW